MVRRKGETRKEFNERVKASVTKQRRLKKESERKKKKPKVEEKRVTTFPTIELKAKPKPQGVVSKALDIAAAPLSQTKETLTKGPLAGGRAVRASRERIEAGVEGEAGRVIGRTLLGTAAAAGGALVGGELVAAGGISSIAAGRGLNLAVGANIERGLTGAKTILTSKFSRNTLAGLAGTSGIMTWLASDNIISSMNIFTRDLRQAVTFGQMDADAALEQLQEGQKFVQKARSFINTNTMLNPLLWPFRNIIMTNVEAAQLVLDNNRESIIRAGAEQQNETPDDREE